ALLTRLDREIMLLRNTVVNGEQATKYIDTLIEEFRTAKPLFATSNTSPVTQSTLPLAAAGSTSPDLNPASSGMLPLDISHSLPLQKGTTLRLARDDLQPSDQGPSPLDGAEPSSD
ncbi:MAG: hypothetical protein ACRENC_05440, partial [Gemmatimonadaceae bacterium]